MMSVVLAWGIVIVAAALPRRGPARELRERGLRRVREEWRFAWEEERGFVLGLFVSGWYCAVLVLLELRS